jgi:hypothetical protein
LGTAHCQQKRTSVRGTFRAMRDPHERLKFIRKLRGYDAAVDAARAFGWNENSYKSAENGIRPLTGETADHYAHAFRVRPGWLLYGEGDWDTAPSNYGKIDLALPTIPILDWDVVTNSANISGVVEQAKLALPQKNTFELSPLAFRLINKDDSMVDKLGREEFSFRRGDHLVFDPERQINPGCYVLVRILADNSTIFRQYWERGSDADGRRIAKLHAFNQAWTDQDVTLGVTGEIIARLVQHIVYHP